MNIEQMKEHPFLSDRMMFIKHKDLPEVPHDEDEGPQQKDSNAISELEYKRR